MNPRNSRDSSPKKMQWGVVMVYTVVISEPSKGHMKHGLDDRELCQTGATLNKVT